ncbi:MAG TPA: methyl-accepting chemotaxis protein, partial [Planctomycetota bacterium]|nr:methyl-accepting chemotaxis protein [Planctomycetota bacterium]
MAKLLSAFALVCGILGVVGYVGITKMSRINDMLNTLYERDMLGSGAVREAALDLVSIGRATANVALARERAEKEQYAAASEKFFAAMNDQLGKVTLVTAEGKAKLADLQAKLPPYHEAFQAAIAAAMTEDREGLHAARARQRELADAVEKDLEEICASKDALGKKTYEESDEVYAEARRTLLGLVVGALAIAMGLGYGVARMIARPLGEAVTVLETVAAGDFTRRLDFDSRDEVGKLAAALNHSVASMRDALTQVTEVAGSVGSAAQQLSAGAESLSSGAQEQASSLEETAASLEEMTSTVKQNAGNAEQAAQVATGSRDVAEKGGAVVERAVEAMTEINKASKRIAEIITAIDEIAFQTNIHALNAAVEAARAGEQGRGFAVVASEVRSLAQRSATAAKEIKALIQDSVRKVDAGSTLVNESG